MAWNSTFRKLRSWHLVPSLHGKKMRKQWKQWDFILGGSKITADGDCSHEIKRCLLLGRKARTKLDSMFKKQRHYLANKGLYGQSYDFSSSCVWMWELDHKESWVPMNGCLWTVVLEKTLKGSLNCKEIKPVHPNGNQPWIFIGRADAKAETPNTLATWYKELTHWRRPWHWERYRTGEEGSDRGWDG